MTSGIPVSKGIAMGKVFLIEEPQIVINRDKIENVDAELANFKSAVETTVEQINKIKENAVKTMGESVAVVFDAHLMFLVDPEFVGQIENKIKNEAISGENAIEQVSEMFAQIFASMDDAYMQERAADVRDVAKRLIQNTLGIPSKELSLINEKVILVAEDLTPSQTAQINKEYVQGFITDIGGQTSHTAIMARTLELPAIVGAGDITSKVKDGEFMVLDAMDGKTFLSPEQNVIDEYEAKKAEYEAFKVKLRELKDLHAETKDGHVVELAANVGTPNDVKGANENGAEAVGLYRTEFLYMDSSELPSEEVQFEAYKAVAEGMNGKPVIIRTLDIGGDKELPYLDLPHEMNPFLGWRAVRICLEKTDIFNTQLRAILRASAFGKVRVMFPMISNVEEIRACKEYLEEAKSQLKAEGVAFDENIEVGIMIEIPSAAVIADILANEVSFFSIGTNDLCQYTLAVDRMNEKISNLYQPMHPAILRLVKNVIDASHAKGGFTGMCGEMASNPVAAVILLGLGLDEFSMTATAIPQVKNVIRSVSYAQAKEIADHVLNLPTEADIVAYVEGKLAELGL